ncbi:MAG: ABC transporter permease subunit [Candidatus Poribacteria bacterium]|nr:ABC transporter permease subunit [Candidatus Poribacteria bacterium]
MAKHVALHTILVLGAAMFALPFVWMVSTSLKWDREVFDNPANWFARLVPRLPYRVVRTPYVATLDTKDFTKPEPLHDLSWDLLKTRLEPRLWDAAQPILIKRQVPDSLRNELRYHLTRDLWHRLIAEKPDSLWNQPLNVIEADLASSVTLEKVNAGWELLYRAVRLASPTIQDTERIEYAVDHAEWMTQRGDARLVEAVGDIRQAEEVWADYRNAPKPPYATYFYTSFRLPLDAKDVRAITIPLHGDESYHHLTAVVELNGVMYQSDEPIVLENYTWQEVTLQLRGVKEPHERDNVVLNVSGRETEVVGARLARVTLTLHRANFFVGTARKFIRNYRDAATFVRFWRFVWNTVIVTALSIVAQLISCSLIAYGFARLKWPGRDAVFLLVLSTMMLPAQVTMIPVFLIMKWFGFYDTLTPLWIGSLFGSAFFIFLLRQFLLGIPRDLEEAAKIDGCGYFGIYWRIMLPLIKPALAAIAIFQFMGAWNDFLGPLVYVTSEEKMTLSLGLQLFQSMHGTEYGMLMAASAVMTLPVIVIFFFAQRYFIQGVTLTGLKG